MFCRRQLYNRTRLRATATGALAGVLGLTPGVTRADGNYESVAFGVNDYSSIDACNDSDLMYSIETADAWQDKMADAVSGPDYDVTPSVYIESQVDPEDFIDSFNDETATTGVDWADVAFFNGHGGSYCPGSSSPDSNTRLLTGDDAGSVDCVVELGSYGNEMVLGGGASGSDLNMLFMHASTSLRWCVVEDGIIFEIDGGGSGAQFALLAGFHNSPLNETTNDTEVESYIGMSIEQGVGENYIYQLALGQGDWDRECTSMVITSASLSYANTEFFYGRFKDFKSTGTHNQHWYYSNCGDTCNDNAACN